MFASNGRESSRRNSLGFDLGRLLNLIVVLMLLLSWAGGITVSARSSNVRNDNQVISKSARGNFGQAVNDTSSSTDTPIADTTTPAPTATLTELPSSTPTPASATDVPPSATPEVTDTPVTEVPTGMPPANQMSPMSAQAAPALGCVGDTCTFQVNASSDDAGPNPVYYCSYSTYWNEVYFGLCPNNTPMVSGFRFTNVTITQGTKIAQAYLEFTVDGPYTDQVSLNFYGEAIGNSSTFSFASHPGGANRPPLTQNFTTWNIPSTDQWQLGQIRDTPDLTQVIQEIINRPDWASGNALSIIAQSLSASGVNRHRRVIGYDRPVWYPGYQYAAKLVIKLTSNVAISINEATGNPVTTLGLNNDGWPTPDPLVVKVTLTCPAGGGDCTSPSFGSLGLTIGSPDNSARLYVYSVDPNENASEVTATCTAGPTSYSYTTYVSDCVRSGASALDLPAGSTKTLNWSVWIQPSQATTFTVTANYGQYTNTASVSVPQASIHPVIVIPGIFGSVNFLGNWNIVPIVYDKLLNELRLVGYEDGISLFTFPYDWRQRNEDSGNGLKNALSGFLKASSASGRSYVRSDSADVIAHSMGGLVSRSYIQSSAYQNNVHRLITLGTPNLGAPMAYLLADGLDPQDFLGRSLLALFRIFAEEAGYCTSTRYGCKVTDPDLYRYILDKVPSARELYPTMAYNPDGVGGYLIDSQTSKPYPYLAQRNNFLESLNANVGTLIHNLGSSNIVPIVGQRPTNDTMGYFQVVQTAPWVLPLWANGYVPNADSIKYVAGDDTVPAISADLSKVDSSISSISVNRADDGITKISHMQLPTQLQLTAIKPLIGGTRPPFGAGFADVAINSSLTFFALSPVDMQVIDPLGRRTGVDFATGKELSEIPGSAVWRSNVPGEPDCIFINNPTKGAYTIKLVGTGNGNYTVGADSVTGTGVLTIANFTGVASPGINYQYTVNYDPNTLPVTPLSLQWLPPLDSQGQILNVKINQTIPLKFTVQDAAGNFVEDNNVIVWVIDPSAPGKAIAAFSTTGQGQQGQSTAIRIQDSMYIVNLHLKDYSFQTGKTYIVGAEIFGQPMQTTAISVSP